MHERQKALPYEEYIIFYRCVTLEKQASSTSFAEEPSRTLRHMGAVHIWAASVTEKHALHLLSDNRLSDYPS